MQINRRNFIKLSGLSMVCKSAVKVFCEESEYESGRKIDPEAVKRAFREPPRGGFIVPPEFAEQLKKNALEKSIILESHDCSIEPLTVEKIIKIRDAFLCK